jgi:hypothetical protein
MTKCIWLDIEQAIAASRSLFPFKLEYILAYFLWIIRLAFNVYKGIIDKAMVNPESIRATFETYVE